MAAKIGRSGIPGIGKGASAYHEFLNIIDEKLHFCWRAPQGGGFNFNRIPNTDHCIVHRVGNPHDQVRIVWFDMHYHRIVVVEAAAARVQCANGIPAIA